MMSVYSGIDIKRPYTLMEQLETVQVVLPKVNSGSMWVAESLVHLVTSAGFS